MTNRATELIQELVTIPDHELKKVPVVVFSMLRGMCNRLSDDDTLGVHAACRELLADQGRKIEKLESDLKKATKKGKG